MNLCIVDSVGGFTRSSRRGHHFTSDRTFSRSRVVESGTTTDTNRFGKAFDGKRQFNTLAEKWTRETRHLSSPTQKYLHPSYAQIIGLGNAAVPLVLSRMKTLPGDWFFALRALTGENPVPPSLAGDMRRMTEIWIKWGEHHGHI